MKTESVHFSSKNHSWETPQPLFDLLDREFSFALDVCAEQDTAKCERYFTPQINGLAQRWAGVCWMNPPYGRGIVKWVERAYQTAAAGRGTVVCLVSARVDTRWWWDYARHSEVRFLPGRLKFGGAKNSAPFPSAVLIFRAGLPAPKTIYWDWRLENHESQIAREPAGKA